MEKIQPASRIEATLAFSARFTLELSILTLLYSIIPVLFVNLPFGMLLKKFGELYPPLLLSANLLAIFLSGAFATKRIFVRGLNGFAFQITKESAHATPRVMRELHWRSPASLLPSPYRMKFLFLKTLLTLLLSLVGLVLSLLAYISYKDVSELATWQRMSATITSTAIKQEFRSKGVSYCPEIHVSFTLPEAQHTSPLKISQASCAILKQSALKTIKKYKTGNTVEVFVNPSRPSEAKLTTYSLGWTFYMNSTIGPLFLIAAFLIPFIKGNPAIKEDERQA